MLEDARIAVIVPAYNEARLILATLRSIPAYVDHIYVVDDASEDRTYAMAKAHRDARVQVVRHARNQGVGAAIVTGYKRAFADRADAVAVMAGDAQMHPCDLRRLLAPIVEGRADYAKGNRLGHPKVRQRMPRMRLWGNRLLSWLTRLATGLPIRDSQCGYTVLSRRVADTLCLDALWPRYGYPNDLLGRLQEIGARIEDVTVRPIYGRERSGIGLRHALFVVPYVLLRVWWRRQMQYTPTNRRPHLAPANRVEHTKDSMSVEAPNSRHWAGL